ncbi:hypothetical protein [Pseudoalteromonas sp. Ld20]
MASKQFQNILHHITNLNYALENYLSWFRFMEDNTEYSDQTWIKEAL